MKTHILNTPSTLSLHSWYYWTSRAPFWYTFCYTLYDSVIFLFTSEFMKFFKNKSLVLFIIQCSSSWHSDTMDKLILFDNRFMIVLYLNAKIDSFCFHCFIYSVYQFLLFINFFPVPFSLPGDFSPFLHFSLETSIF